jgi:hypothetical protein
MAFDGDVSIFFVPGFDFLMGFELVPDPVGGRQQVTYAICMTASIGSDCRSVVTGSATRAGNRR